MVKILLKVTHTHEGAVYQAGNVIDVDDFTARWIIERGIGEVFDESKQSTDTTKDEKAVNKKKEK